jgi:hypothetical protein
MLAAGIAGVVIIRPQYDWTIIRFQVVKRLTLEDAMNSVVKHCAVGMAAFAGLLMTGCSPDAPTAAPTGSAMSAKPAAKVEPVAAKAAFWPLYKAAQSWAPDVVMLGLASKDVTGYVNDEGKAPMWQATFGSQSLHKYREDTYAIATVLPNVHKGLSAGFPGGWAGPNKDVLPIDTENFTVDSDAAYKTAAADAGTVDYLKKNAGKKLTSMQLGNVPKMHALVWYVQWGDKTNGYGVYVDATSGKVLKGK